MDIFVEQIVRRKFSGLDYLIFAGVVLGGIVLLLLSMMFLPAFTFIVLVGICVGGYFLMSSRSLEYEYSVTNGDITVDKIINRSRRKRIVSFDLKEAEGMGHYKAEQHTGKNYDARLIASEAAAGTEEDWYLDARSTKKGHVLLVFSPDERVLASIKPFLKRQVMLDAYGRN